MGRRPRALIDWGGRAVSYLDICVGASPSSHSYTPSPGQCPQSFAPRTSDAVGNVPASVELQLRNAAS